MPQPSPPSRTTPTARLEEVLAEAEALLAAHSILRDGLIQTIQLWGQVPEAQALTYLQDLLDSAALPNRSAISEARAYLKVNGRKLDRARRSARKARGQEPIPAYIPQGEPSLPQPSPSHPPLSLEDIEAKLQTLDLSSE